MVFPIQQGSKRNWIYKIFLLGTMLISVLVIGCGKKHVQTQQIVFTIES